MLFYVMFSIEQDANAVTNFLCASYLRKITSYCGSLPAMCIDFLGSLKLR